MKVKLSEKQKEFFRKYNMKLSIVYDGILQIYHGDLIIFQANGWTNYCEIDEIFLVDKLHEYLDLLMLAKDDIRNFMFQ